MEKERPQKKLSRMAIQQRNNVDEESGAIKTEGQSTEEFKAGIKGNDYIKMNESQMKKLS